MNALRNGLAGWVAFCEFRPRTVLSVLVVLTALVGAYVWQNFAIDSSLDKLIRPSDDLRWHQANEAFKQSFPELQQTSIVVVSGADLPAVDASARRLAAAFREAGRFQFVFAPALDDFLRDHRAYFLDADQLEEWVRGVQYDYGAMLRVADSADLTNAAFTLADQVAATNGLRLPTLLKSIAENFRDGVPGSLRVEAYPHLVPEAQTHHLIIMLKGQQDTHARLPNAAQVALIRELMDEAPAEPGVRVRLTGDIPLAHEEISMALDGIGIAGTLSLVLLGLILHFGVRSWRIIIATFALLAVGVLWTLGFAILAVGSFNTLALIFVVMFFGLGVDFSVHFALRMREGMVPGAREDAEVHVVREIGPALFLCMLTSSIAFLSFVPTAYRGLGELGIVSAGGMLIAFFLTMTLLPAFFSVFGMPLPIPGKAGSWRRRLRFRAAPVLIAVGLASLVALWFARDLRFDYSVLALRDPDTEAMSTLLELQDAGITTDYSISVLARNAGEARSLKQRLLALPEVQDVISPSDLLPEEQDEKAAMLRELDALLGTIDEVLPGDPAVAREGLLQAVEYLEEVQGLVAEGDQALVASFLDGLRRLHDAPERLADLNRSLTEALGEELGTLRRIVSARSFGLPDLPADLRRRLVSPTGEHLLTVLPASVIDSRQATDEFVHAVMSVTPDVGGRAVVEWGVGGVVVESFVEAVTLAVAAIGLLLIAYFRGLVLPLVVLTPLALTTLFTFGLIEGLGLTLNMANVLVVPLIFGLGVDAGIHVVHRFSAGDGDVGALLSSSTARAVVISALTTIGTFFSLSFGPHKWAASVGLLLTIAISIMLLLTFLVVPALLELLSRRSGPGTARR